MQHWPIYVGNDGHIVLSSSFHALIRKFEGRKSSAFKWGSHPSRSHLGKTILGDKTNALDNLREDIQENSHALEKKHTRWKKR